MTGRFLRSGSLLFLAVVFTVGLTFATVELPYRIDGFLQNAVHTPGGDSHADEVARLKTELFMAHYHVRAVGYAGFFLLLGLIALGFSTPRTGLAALGAVGVMLPAFAQFAGVMFFLAGLGALNALWLPILDISYGVQDWGKVINAPNDLLRWLLGLVGLDSIWPTTLFFIGSGVLIFILGSYAWLTARARGKGVADFWVYRVSRHPQYLGWILWTYGAYLLIQRFLYPKRSWGIGASLPWLLSTMVIVGVALLEELNMRRRHGQEYEAYRKSAPFLFPVPRRVERLIAAPFRWLFGKDRPDQRREVVLVLGLYTAVLVAISAVFYAGGLDRIRNGLASEGGRAADMESLVERVETEPDRRHRNHVIAELAAFGEPAVPSLVGLLEGDDPALRAVAAESLGNLGSVAAVPALCLALFDADESVRFWAANALDAIRPPEAIGPLMEVLEDPASNIRMGALRTLAAMGVEDVVKWAPEFMEDEHHWIRSQAVDALGALSSPSAIPVLSPRLADEEPGVRRSAVVALMRIGAPEARPLLQAALSDDDFETRVYAAEALKRLPGG
jgi:protein-S-isoprenylcysteine O-methyltransferase Ste14